MPLLTSKVINDCMSQTFTLLGRVNTVNINSVMEKGFPRAQLEHVLFCPPERAAEKEEGTQEINVPFFFFLVGLHNTAK